MVLRMNGRFRRCFKFGFDSRTFSTVGRGNDDLVDRLARERWIGRNGTSRPRATLQRDLVAFIIILK